MTGQASGFDVNRTIPSQQPYAITPNTATLPRSAARIATKVAKANVTPIMYRLMTRTGLTLVSLTGGWVSVNADAGVMRRGS